MTATETPLEPRFQPLDPAAFDEDQKALYGTLQRAVADPLGGVAGMWLRSPATGSKLARLVGHFAAHPTLPAALRELAIIVTARHYNAQLSWDAHGKKALAAGVPAEVVAAVGEGRAVGKEHGEFAAVTALCRELLQDRFVSATTFAEIRGLFDDRQIVDLISSVGLASASCMCQIIQYPEPAPLRTTLED